MANVTNHEFWVVRDPDPRSEVKDVLFSLTLGNASNYMVGCRVGGEDRWKTENHTVYDNWPEAVIDAHSRLLKIKAHST